MQGVKIDSGSLLYAPLVSDEASQAVFSLTAFALSLDRISLKLPQSER